MSQIHSLKELKAKIDKNLVFFNQKLAMHDLKKINLLLLEKIKISYFQTLTAVKYLVDVKKGHEGEIYLYPFDHNLLGLIYSAIENFKTPWRISLQKDRICLNLPIITTAKKAAIIKEWKSETENCRVHIRSLRQNFLNYCKNVLALPQQELVQNQKEVQKIVDLANKEIEKIFQQHLHTFQKV